MSEMDERIKNRLAGKKMMQDQAIKGDPICGAACALESIASDMGLGFMAGTAIDFSEEDDEDIRPY